MSDITLSPDQAAALYAINDWIDSGSPELRFGGLAGTGKTTLIAELCKTQSAQVMSLTGKAVHVLREKGVDATTIHGHIYSPVRNPDGSVSFKLRPRHHVASADLWIVDEASMISEELRTDLLSFCIPILWVGDHGQLEPVGGALNLMEHPDIKLEKIHRYAGDLVKFAHALRNNAPTPELVADQVIIDSPNRAGDYVATGEYDQIIVGFNDARHAINALMRDYAFGSSKKPLYVGDRIICLRNDKDKGLFNGMQATVLSVHGVDHRTKTVTFSAQCDDGFTRELTTPWECFGTKYKVFDGRRPRDWSYWDYAYAITCHKAQGSEWNKVLVVEAESQLWDVTRWGYTAATRARQKLVYLTHRELGV